MTYNTLTYQVDDGVLLLTLNRPQALNAFTVEMAHELIEAFGRASEDDAVGAIVVTGSGRAFCAGMDLSVPGNVFGLDETMTPTRADLTDRLDDPAVIAGVRDTGGRVSLAIYDCAKPVIGAINGAAVGVGATMTLAMDIRMVSETTKIGFVFGRLGIVPEACSSYFLPRIVGLQQAMEEAKASGLARSIHPADQLVADAKVLARKFVDGRSPVAVALTRQLMVRGLGLTHPLQAHQADSLAMFYTSIGDGKEGVAAFLEKRPPAFNGRASDLPDVFPG
jgi:enoyl-CoA hydratase/carnithine racemase